MVTKSPCAIYTEKMIGNIMQTTFKEIAEVSRMIKNFRIVKEFVTYHTS